MTILTESNYTAEWLLSSEGCHSIKTGVLVSGQNLADGTVLGQIVANSTTTASAVTGTGVLTITMGALGANAIVGAYTATCITSGASAVYEIETPTGLQLAQNLTVGAGATDIDGHFTITAVNGTNSAVGDVFTVTIANATTNSITASAVTGTGNGAITVGAVGGLAREGVYRAVCTEAAANAGTFAFYTPMDDQFLANVTVAGGATSVGGHFTITIADGSTDFVVGDNFTVTINLADVKFTAHNPAAVDGSQNAVAILYGAVDATSADKACTTVARLAEVFDGKLVWKSGITAAQKAVAVASLESKLITVRA